MLKNISNHVRSFRCKNIPLRWFSQKNSKLRKTPLWNLHQELNAKMTEFSGWDMPLNYSDGIIQEHLYCRSNSGLFDVSHMVSVYITGKDRVRYAEQVFPAGIQELNPGQGCLTCLPNLKGGLLDDCIITNMGDYLNLVINAGHENQDLSHMEYYRQQFDGEVRFIVPENQGLLALQGPEAGHVLARHINNGEKIVANWKFMTMQCLSVGGIQCQVARSGYTGEDGFEISCPGDQAELLARSLLDHPEVKPIGLAARDSLRLEAGLCLYGNDIDETTTPIEAMLAWTIPKRRRTEANFVGAEMICAQLAHKSMVRRKRIGWISEGGPVRKGQAILNEEGTQVGTVTSGSFGPSIKKPIGMGYVEKHLSKVGTRLNVEGRRGKLQEIQVSKMPFIPSGIVR